MYKKLFINLIHIKIKLNVLILLKKNGCFHVESSRFCLYRKIMSSAF